MSNQIELKLLNLKINDCTSEGDLKSIFKEITNRNDSADHSKSIVASIEGQLRLSESTDDKQMSGEISNVLLFIKGLAETRPQVGIQKFDDLPDAENELGKGIPTSPSSNSPKDFIYEFIIEPLSCQLWDHLILILNGHCKSYIRSLAENKGPKTLSMHELHSLILKLIRTGLALFKRIELASECGFKTTDERLADRLLTFGNSLCEFLEQTEFDLALDIKCNIGLSLCHVVKLVSTAEEPATSFFASIFENQAQQQTCGLRKKILELSVEDINRIAFAFGVLGIISHSDDGFTLIMQRVGASIMNIDNGTKEAANLGSARVLEIWADKLSTARRDTLMELSNLFPELEFFIFSYLPGHIDAVKTCCRYMLSSLTRIYDRMEDSNCCSLVMRLVEKVLAKPLHVKWIGISCISKNTPKAIGIMNIHENVPEMLLCCQRTSSNTCADSYVSLMIQHFLKVSEEEWEEHWVDPLFTNQQTQTKESNWPQKRAIVTSILKGKCDNIKLALMRSVINRMNLSVQLCSESSLLAVATIKIATDLEIKMDKMNGETEDVKLFRGIVPRDRLISWLMNGDHQIRLTGLSLLVETKKTSELISREDFECLKLSFCYSFTSQSPAFRQQFLSYFKKLMKRLKDGRNLVLRNKETNNSDNYHKFLHWLWTFLTSEEGLFPGANFGRRCQALECLSELTTVFDMNALGVEPTSDNLAYVQWLDDPYEYNKMKALQILIKIPMPDLDENQSPQAAKILNTALALCESVKPPHSLTGRYLIVFLIKKCHHVQNYSVNSLLALIYDKLKGIFDKVLASSLIEVAAETPMYGYIRCLRMIFNETKEYLFYWEMYRNFSKNLLDLCVKMNDVLFPVLGSAAPEGFLPGLPDSQPQNSKVIRSINAQMLLVCSWRSMKDICLLMAEMCALFPLEGETENFILNFDQVVLIGDHLSYLLKTLMHRGVFEQVYIGFRQLATRLFKSPSQRLNKLPEMWLNSAMDEELVNSKCITRRSAGLPFLFQALLSPVSSDEVFVNKFVSRLFCPELTSCPTARIHAMNVLRALFRDATFSRAMMPNVPFGLQLAFKGLKASDWTERNAGLMLFGAVIKRTFGPKLNIMSAPTFFRKFPQMYDFLLGEINACSAGVETKGYLAVTDYTYHVLLLLSSFAASGVAEDKHFRLMEFVPPIRECGSSADSHVRTIAANALIPFLSDPVDKNRVILEILSSLTCDVVHGANNIHGCLVQIRVLLDTISSDLYKNEPLVKFNDFIARSSAWSTECPIIFETLLEICATLGEGALLSYRVINANFEATFGSNIVNRRSVPGLPAADMRVAATKVMFALSDDTINFSECVYDWMQRGGIVLVEELLKYLDQPSSNFSKRSVEEGSMFLYVATKRYLRENFKSYCQTTVEEKFLEVLSKIPSPAFKEWAQFVDKEDFLNFFNRLTIICDLDGGTNESKAFSIVILGNLVIRSNEKYLEEDHIEKFCELLTTFSDSNLDDYTRLAVARSVPEFPSEKMDSFTVFQQLKLWSVVFALAQDDASTVRAEIADKIKENNSETCERRSLEILVEYFLNDFASEYTLEALVLLVGLLLKDDYEITALEADDGEEDRLFDKSEMNGWNEPVLLAKILEEELKYNLELTDRMKIHFRSSHLNAKLGDFFIFVSNSTISNLEWKTLTLEEIVSVKLTSYVDVQSCSSCILPSSEKHFVLKWIQNKLLSVLS